LKFCCERANEITEKKKRRRGENLWKNFLMKAKYSISQVLMENFLSFFLLFNIKLQLCDTPRVEFCECKICDFFVLSVFVDNLWLGGRERGS
jgi:hypothetical protein